MSNRSLHRQSIIAMRRARFTWRRGEQTAGPAHAGQTVLPAVAPCVSDAAALQYAYDSYATMLALHMHRYRYPQLRRRASKAQHKRRFGRFGRSASLSYSSKKTKQQQHKQQQAQQQACDKQQQSPHTVLAPPPAPYVSNAERMARSTFTPLPALLEGLQQADAAEINLFGSNHTDSMLRRWDVEPLDDLFSNDASPSSSSSSSTDSIDLPEVDFYGSNHTSEYLQQQDAEDDLFQC
jgi:hypothetical protein